MITVTLPLRLLSEANERGHWSKGAKRAKEQRGVVRLALTAWANGRPGGQSGRWLVTLTRIAPRELDGDNLQRALKAVRDGVADALGIDDGDERIEWRYEQRGGEPIVRGETLAKGGYGVSVRIEAREAPPETAREAGARCERKSRVSR